MTYRPILDNVFVLFESALQDEIRLPSGHVIYKAAFLEKEQNATCVGVIHSVGAENKLGIKPGEKVAVSYQVVAKYTLSEDGVTTYHNCFWLDDVKVWKCTSAQVMAVYRDGWIGVDDWVLMKEIIKPSSKIIWTPEEVVKGKGDLNGEVVLFDEQFRSLYNIEGEKFIVLREHRLLGKEIAA